MPETHMPVAIVTGATSGIGLAVAQSLAESRHRVFICSRSVDSVESTVRKLRDEGHEVDGTVCDVRSAEDVYRFVQAATDRFGTVDVLVNNAGRSGGGTTADITDDLWLDVIDTNLTSAFRMTREVLNTGGMRQKDRGSIINIASTGGKQGVPLGAPYSASKGGVIAFSKALGKELAPTGITVNAVCPGYVETPMAEHIRGNYARVWNTTTDDVLQRFEAKIPLGRYSTPEEVAGLVAYLVTPTASSITAQAINVCGGLGNF